MSEFLTRLFGTSRAGSRRGATGLLVLALQIGLLCTILPTLRPIEARTPKQHWGEGFSIDLEQPYDVVLRIVQAIAGDGIVRGSSEYKDTSGLDGARRSDKSDEFPAWSEPGTAIYKIRPGTLAPQHFFESADQGTVTVRYVVQSLGGSTTRLRIDALFVGNSHHGTHPSDGQVENAEFEAIAAQLKDIADVEERKKQDLALEQQERETARLQDELSREQNELSALKQTEQALVKQVNDLTAKRTVQVSVPANLKAGPYTGASTVRQLQPGEALTVLLKTPSWYRVQTISGEHGWIYRLMLSEVQ